MKTLFGVLTLREQFKLDSQENKQIGSLLKLQTMATKKWRKNSNEKPVLHFNTK